MNSFEQRNQRQQHHHAGQPNRNADYHLPAHHGQAHPNAQQQRAKDAHEHRKQRLAAELDRSFTASTVLRIFSHFSHKFQVQERCLLESTSLGKEL